MENTEIPEVKDRVLAKMIENWFLDNRKMSRKDRNVVWKTMKSWLSGMGHWKNKAKWHPIGYNGPKNTEDW